MASCIQLDKLKKSKSWFIDFQYDPKRDQTGEVRNILLIVATLIAAVTFQSGVNPPGGVWQDNTNHTLCEQKRAQGNWTDPPCDKSHVAGTAIYASQSDPFYVFLVFNTVALSTSVLVIMSLTYNFPFHLELFIAATSMLVTYGSAIFAVTPHESHRFRYVLTAAAFPFMLRGLIYAVKFQAKHHQDNDHMCGKCRSGISEDNSCRKCGSKIPENSEGVKV
ncbi:hypothetical protein SO802_009018 [Lithocarpus litseifolius]|uniref:PGG domain-containing protein n=1 Tax=Lithocarpus litseifolius TaxID=425828 RepID=A0AAW2DEH7_9ROSI